MVEVLQPMNLAPRRCWLRSIRRRRYQFGHRIISNRCYANTEFGAAGKTRCLVTAGEPECQGNRPRTEAGPEDQGCEAQPPRASVQRRNDGPRDGTINPLGLIVLLPSPGLHERGHGYCRQNKNNDDGEYFKGPHNADLRQASHLP